MLSVLQSDVNIFRLELKAKQTKSYAHFISKGEYTRTEAKTIKQ